MQLSERFIDALDYAARLHARQERKGSGVPYVAHLLAVASLVLDYGGDEDQAIAGLLHDVVEDQGGKKMFAEITSRYGQDVADMVKACTDAQTVPKPAWRKRKQRAVAAVAKTSPAALLVESADKLHNARSVLADYRVVGDDLWKRFKGGREGTLWYYRAMADAMMEVFDSPIARELERVVGEIEGLAEASE